MTTKAEKQKNKKTLPSQANPLHKVYELLWLMQIQKVDYYDVESFKSDPDSKLKLTEEVSNFILDRARKDFVPQHQKLLDHLVKSGYAPKRLEITQPLHSIRILDMGTLTWLKNRIEIMSMIGLPATSIYTEIKRLTGDELYSLEEVRSYIYFFWNFSYSDGWDDSFGKPLHDYLKADKLLSNFYSKPIKILSGEVTPLEMLIELGVDDPDGIQSWSNLIDGERRIESHLINAIKKSNADGTLKWESARIRLNEIKDRNKGSKERIILRNFSPFEKKRIKDNVKKKTDK